VKRWYYSILCCCIALAGYAGNITPTSSLKSYYANVQGQSGSALVSALNTLCNTNYEGVSYGSGTCSNCVWGAYQTTDVYPADSVGKAGHIWDMYSNCDYIFQVNQGSSSSTECAGGYNREHSLPKSWFGVEDHIGIGPGTDLFHIYPTDVHVNSTRSNYPYGKVVTITTTFGNGSKMGKANLEGYKGIVFEPIDQYKGDFARSYLYMLMKWNAQGTSFMQDSNGKVMLNDDMTSSGNYGLTAYGLAVLIAWHRQDPVSQKEIDRNNAVQKIQGNRNPFIDYPYLAEYLWGKKKDEAVNTKNLLGSFQSEFIPGKSDGWLELKPVYYEYDGQICEGQYYSDHNFKDLNVANDYTRTYTSQVGGDSIVTLHLVINKKYTFNESKTITQGSQQSWRGYDLSTYAVGSHTLTQELNSSTGCDSIYQLALTVEKKEAELVTCYEANKAEKDVEVKLRPCVVVYINESYIYVADATGGALIYKYNYGLAVGDTITGFVGTSSPYKGLPELKPVSKIDELTIKHGNELPPKELCNIPDTNECNIYGVYRNVTIRCSALNGTLSTDTIVLNNGEVAQMHNKFKLSYTFEEGYTYDMVCVTSRFQKDTNSPVEAEICPIQFTKIEKYVPLHIHVSEWFSGLDTSSGLTVSWAHKNGKEGEVQATKQTNDWYIAEVPTYKDTVTITALNGEPAPSDDLVGNECLILTQTTDSKRELRSGDCAAYTDLYLPKNLNVVVNTHSCQFTWESNGGERYGIGVYDQSEQLVYSDTLLVPKAQMKYKGAGSYSWWVWVMDKNLTPLSERVKGTDFVTYDNPYEIKDMQASATDGNTYQLSWSATQSAPKYKVKLFINGRLYHQSQVTTMSETVVCAIVDNYTWRVYALDQNNTELVQSPEGKFTVNQVPDYSINNVRAEISGSKVTLSWESAAPVFILTIADSQGNEIADELLTKSSFIFTANKVGTYTATIHPYNTEQTFTLANDVKCIFDVVTVATGADKNAADTMTGTKRLKDGRLLIFHNGNVYNAMGIQTNLPH